MSIKTHFTIKDLENLSGVKAHTIRMWEKRYRLLSPGRTETNIRKYNLENLKRLLDVTFLYQEGFKISKIAEFEISEMKVVVANTAINNYNNFARTGFKNAMLKFDSKAFDSTYNSLLDELGFQKLFFEVFIPFLQEIGVLWHTDTIDISHERFIAELIKRKTIIHIENQREKFTTANKAITFCLFSPPNEIHDLALLYANFELEKANFHTIYLGPNTPLESLQLQFNKYQKLVFVSYNTQRPFKEDIPAYIKKYRELTYNNNECDFWFMGPKVKELDEKLLPKNMVAIHTFDQFASKIAEIKNQY